MLFVVVCSLVTVSGLQLVAVKCYSVFTSRLLTGEKLIGKIGIWFCDVENHARPV